jgi:hypothetical protein
MPKKIFTQELEGPRRRGRPRKGCREEVEKNLLSVLPFLPMKMEQIECSETSAYKIQTPGNHPEENIQHTEQGESLKSRIKKVGDR